MKKCLIPLKFTKHQKDGSKILPKILLPALKLSTLEFDISLAFSKLDFQLFPFMEHLNILKCQLEYVKTDINVDAFNINLETLKELCSKH